MYGTSLNCAMVGFGLPEYAAFGTKVTLPEVSKEDSFQGPSTVPQIGLVAYVLVSLV